jgi:hypothetical protein
MANNLQVPAPQTPRANKSHPLHKHTPSFSFGLSFLPSFNFNSPIGVSPQKFFHATSSINKPNEKIVGDERVILSTPPKSGKSFLDSLTSSTKKPQAGDGEDESLIKEDIDIWSSLGNDSNTQNFTNLTSIYEESDKENYNQNQDFLTPKKLVKPKNLQPAPSINRKDSISDKTTVSTPSSTTSSTKPESYIKKFQKRRKLSSTVLDSPNNSIASQIDSSVASPISTRKHSDVSLQIGENEDKVWYPELDDVLINAFMKYRQFKENHGFASSSVLANTSQNKVLSRMLLNKTGLSRTSKQIASRLFRLAKSKKLDKPSKSQTRNAQSLDDLSTNPFDDFLSSGSISTMDSVSTEVVDRELDLIFSSPTEIDSQPNSHFNLTPTNFTMSLSKDNDTHNFTVLNHNLQSTKVWMDVCNEFPKPIQHFSESILPNVENAQIWTVDHKLNMDVDALHQAITSTPISPFTNSCQQMKSVNFKDGAFKSFMKFEVKYTDAMTELPSMLQWRSLTKIYNENDQQVFENNDIVNGYYCSENDKYDLQVPFMKNFFLGNLHFLVNGGNPRDLKLSVIQIIYDSPEKMADFNPSKCKILSYIVHKFSSGTGCSDFQSIKVPSSPTVANANDIDDNETVLADSSPFRSSPNKGYTNLTPIKRNHQQLSINTNHAKHTIAQGPSSAPIYSASIVSQTLIAPQDDQINFRLPMVQQTQPNNPITGQFTNVPMQEGTFQHNFNNATVGINLQQPVPNQQVPNQQVPNQQVPNQQVPNQQVPTQPMPTPVEQQFMPSTYIVPMTGNAQQFVPAHRQIAYQQKPLQFMGHSMTTQDQFVYQQKSMDMQMGAPMAGGQMQYFMGTQPNVQPVVHHESIGMAHTQKPRHPIRQMLQPNLREAKDAPIEIKFGPILGYDPSKDSKKIHQQNKSKLQNNGLHRFPVNPSLTMYKPKLN